MVTWKGSCPPGTKNLETARPSQLWSLPRRLPQSLLAESSSSPLESSSSALESSSSLGGSSEGSSVGADRFEQAPSVETKLQTARRTRSLCGMPMGIDFPLGISLSTIGCSEVPCVRGRGAGSGLVGHPKIRVDGADLAFVDIVPTEEEFIHFHSNYEPCVHPSARMIPPSCSRSR